MDKMPRLKLDSGINEVVEGVQVSGKISEVLEKDGSSGFRCSWSFCCVIILDSTKEFEFGKVYYDLPIWEALTAFFHQLRDRYEIDLFDFIDTYNYFNGVLEATKDIVYSYDKKRVPWDSPYIEEYVQQYIEPSMQELQDLQESIYEHEYGIYSDTAA